MCLFFFFKVTERLQEELEDVIGSTLEGERQTKLEQWMEVIDNAETEGCPCKNTRKQRAEKKKKMQKKKFETVGDSCIYSRKKKQISKTHFFFFF